MHQTRRFNHKYGFSLVELSVVLVIVAILLATALPLGKAQIDLRNYEGTAERLDIIQKAIALYARTNKGLPCPASKTAAPGSVNFGIATNCTVAPAAGTLEVGANPNYVRIGAVPTRSLNLPDNILFDAWGNRFTYAVTKAATGATLETGIISVVDANGNEITTPPATATYVIFSSGKEGKGTHNRGGVATAACGTTAKDSENCDNDIIFRDTTINDGGTPSLFFDDFVRWSTTPHIKEESGQLPPPEGGGGSPAPGGGGGYNPDVSIDWSNFRGVFLYQGKITYDPENTRRSCSAPPNEYVCDELLVPDDVNAILIYGQIAWGSSLRYYGKTSYMGPQIRHTIPMYVNTTINKRIVGFAALPVQTGKILFLE